MTSICITRTDDADNAVLDKIIDFVESSGFKLVLSDITVGRQLLYFESSNKVRGKKLRQMETDLKNLTGDPSISVDFN